MLRHRPASKKILIPDAKIVSASCQRSLQRSIGVWLPLFLFAMLSTATVCDVARAESKTPHQELTDFLYKLGVEYRQSGRLEEARDEFKKVLILDPDYAQAKAALAQLDRTMSRRQQAIEEALTQVAAPKESVMPVVPVTTPARAPASPPKSTAPKSTLAKSTDIRSPASPKPNERLSTPSPAPKEVPLPASKPTRTIPPPVVVSTPNPPELDAVPFEPVPSFGRTVRIPDPYRNGTQWLYVFGQLGNPDYGALAGPQQVFIEVPSTSSEPVQVKVVDADVRGRHDEMDHWPDTVTTFRLLAGAQQLEQRTVGPEAPDGTTVQFSPVPVDQGERQGSVRRFCLEAEGGIGDDNNLFALEISPQNAQCYSYQPSIRLADNTGERMRFYPGVPAGVAQPLTEQNYDLDPDGGSIRLTPITPDGTRLPSVFPRNSGSQTWSKTTVPVPPAAEGSRWQYEIVKDSQRKGNMSFRLTDGDGKSLPIYFSQQPTTAIQVTPSPRNVEVPTPTAACNAFTFDASKSYDPDGGPLTYHWDFGDGATADGVRVEHTYAQGGSYRVRLTVKDRTDTPCCGSDVEQLLPVNLPPTPKLEAPTTACAGSPVRVSAAQSSDSPGETLRYSWDFGDGATADGAEATHTYTTGGTHRIVLTVDDGRGTSCSTAKAVSTIKINSPPRLVAMDAVRACATQSAGPIEVAFSAAGSRDPDGDPVTFSWEFGDGERSTGERVTHSYQKGGSYTARVTADDGSGSACSIATSTIPVSVNHPPLADADPPPTGCPNAPVVFSAAKSSDADGDPLTYHWEFGDGSSGEGLVARHAYSTTGQFRTTLTVRDSSGMSCDTVTTTVPVAVNAPPEAQMTIRGGRGMVFTVPERQE